MFSDIGGPQLSMYSIREMCCSSIIYQEIQLFKVICYLLVCCCSSFFRDFCKSEGKLSQSCIIFVSVLKSEFLQSIFISAWMYYWSWLENILKHDLWKGQAIGMPRMIYDKELMSHLDLTRVVDEAIILWGLKGNNCRGTWRKALSDFWYITRFSFQISMYSVVND